ncbi:MAG TPA: helix-turn-helix domain-containing protein [Halobacteriales archaeon]|nr:helix-turn-helix domain-containing protein [Halobacteriales archaeon]
MTVDVNPGASATLSPDEAFDVLANETRLSILRTLGEADEPLSFSELFDRTDYDSSGNFSYHLGKLEGHFVRKTDDGYDLSRAGFRVIVAVLSGAMTDDPVMERTPVETPCFLCGGEMEVNYRGENLGMYCTECGGTRGGSSATAHASDASGADIVGRLYLPPAGLRGRTATEILEAAEIWSTSYGQALSRGVCPLCSAVVEQTVEACEDHDAAGGRCAACDQRFGVTIHRDCTNCLVDMVSPFAQHLLSATELIAFMSEHGIDPVAPNAFHFAKLEETIRSADPFEARFTFSADGDALTLTVGEDHSVAEATRHPANRSV